MIKVQASAVLILILLVAAGLGEDPVYSSTIPQAISTPSVPSVLEYPELRAAILASYDAQNYSETARLLSQMRDRYEEKYNSLPYKLLHAKASMLSGNKNEAFHLYQDIDSDFTLRIYSILPLARIAAGEGRKEIAISYYQKYLSNPRNPDYYAVSVEALTYALSLKSSELLLNVATPVQRNSATTRTGQFFIAKAYLLKNDKESARAVFRSLIAGGKKDDVTSHSLSELDLMEGAELSREDQVRRGRLAYQFWNFSLARKYLEPYAMEDMENAYYYGRTLLFLGDLTGAKAVLQKAIETYPQDSWTQSALYQYANICLRDGDFKKAESLYQDLIARTTGKDQENATYKLVQSLRAQSRLQEALVALQPLSYSRTVSQRAPSLFLRGRIYFQAGRYPEALIDFDQLLQSPSKVNSKEVMFWKGLTLEKLKQPEKADQAFSSLSSGADFFALLAQEKLKTAVSTTENLRSGGSFQHVCGLPDSNKESAIAERMAAGDPLAALLYLHLYEEGSRSLDSVSDATWALLNIDPKDRFRKYLEIAHLATLGQNYPTAAYYSEIIQKNFLKNVPLDTLPEDVLFILFPYPFRESVEPFSKERGLDPYYVISIMKQESRFKRFAKSPAFARGLMQLIPPTAVSMAESVGLSDFTPDQLYYPEVNINLGTRYLQEMVKKFGTRPEVIAASYNSGESNVRRWLACTSTDEVMEFFSNIDLKETRDYVVQVKTNYEWYRRIYGGEKNDRQISQYGLAEKD